MTNKQGLFITLEGGEGSGKSTLMRYLVDAFTAQGKEVVAIREPGGTPFAETLREVYFNHEGLSGESVALLMNAGRVDNLEKIINPALREGKVVISDRFSASSLVYQGIRKGIYPTVERITKHVPMVTLFLDVRPEIGLERIRLNNRETNRLDLLPLDEHRIIYQGFKSLQELKPDVYWDVVIDGEQSSEMIQEVVKHRLVPEVIEGLNLGETTSDMKQRLRKTVFQKQLDFLHM